MTPAWLAGLALGGLAWSGLPWSGQAAAQPIGMPGRESGAPIEIQADDAIEWQQKAKAYVARGNATVRQGEVTLRGATLIAYYRGTAAGGTEIWRIDASGDVRISSPGNIVHGDQAVYDVAQGVVVMTGRLGMEAGADRLTARDSLEYWEKRNLVVARGDAIVSRADRRLRADTLSAHFTPDAAGKHQLSRIDAVDNVLISTASEIVRADRGVYDIGSGVATLDGSVRITRGDNQLNGAAAVVDLNTGVSRLVSRGDSRVRGYLRTDTVNQPGQKAP